jgi:phage regulator Rha-like protein
MKLAISNNQKTMSSREIATLTAKRHDHVTRDIEAMLKELGLDVPSFGGIYQDAYGRDQTEYLLTRELSLTLVTGYDVKRRHAINVRWLELEADAAKSTFAIPDFSNPAQAARAWAEQYEARQWAESTKAEIGSRREATAMNTASQAVKKVNRLEVELDQSKQYATIKRMGMIFHGQAFSWSLLKSASADLGLPPLAVFDANYGTVKAYHADAWREAYALEINALEAA